MSTTKKEDYIFTADFNSDGESFENIMKNYIKSLIKIPIGDWNLIENGVKYD